MGSDHSKLAEEPRDDSNINMFDEPTSNYVQMRTEIPLDRLTLKHNNIANKMSKQVDPLNVNSYQRG